MLPYPIAQYMIFGLYFYFELVALITAIVLIKKLFLSTYGLFIPFLAVIVTYELCSYYNVFKHNNVWAVNIVTCVEFLFYSLFISNQLISNKYKQIFNWLIGAGLLYSIVNVLIESIWRLNTGPILVQALIIIFIVSRYFLELMETPLTTPMRLVKQPGFWLNVGVLFFFAGDFLYFASFTELAYKKNHDFLMLSRLISNITNAVLYSCLTVCFLCTQWTKE